MYIKSVKLPELKQQISMLHFFLLQFLKKIWLQIFLKYFCQQMPKILKYCAVEIRWQKYF